MTGAPTSTTTGGKSVVVEAGLDPLDASLVLRLDPDGLLSTFNRAGVLVAADVHVAERLGRLGGDEDDTVALALALAVRAPRVGHVRVDLATVRATAAAEISDEVDIGALPWPDETEWAACLEASPLVATGEEPGLVRPLRLLGTNLYLDRYWRDETAVAADLARRAAWAALSEDSAGLAGLAGRAGLAGAADLADLAGLAGLEELFGSDASSEQRRAAVSAVRRRLTVIAGGPGTGKTTTVAKLLAFLMAESARTGEDPPLVALAAPTGKAAARMEEAVRVQAASLQVGDEVRERLSALSASTIHRLLGPYPGSTSRFRHGRNNRLPHDLVIVDETSMVSLWLMARLLEAVRPDARLVLVGDPEQLASVEAGAVLADIVGPAADRERPEGEVPPTAGGTFGEGIVVLRANHRFYGALADLANAVRAGDADAAIGVLEAGETSVEWLPIDATSAGPEDLVRVRAVAVAAGRGVLEAARASDGGAALAALSRFRLLCAHRHGPAGVGWWNPRVEEWLSESSAISATESGWYVGRPVMMTVNDYSLPLYNGDTGVAIARTADEGRAGEGVGVAFERNGAVVLVSPSRLQSAETVFASTVHKAQGSEFDEVAVVLPEATSRILTRELLYTAITRARERVLIVGSEESIRSAVLRRVARASGLADRLWGS